MYPPPDPNRSPLLTTWPRVSAANVGRFEANTAPTSIMMYPRIFLTTLFDEQIPQNDRDLAPVIKSFAAAHAGLGKIL
jgi:hypothetical protein